jgi:hypothetical protein
MFTYGSWFVLVACFTAYICNVYKVPAYQPIAFALANALIVRRLSREAGGGNKDRH